MKDKIKKVVIPIFLSVICGAISGKLVYSIYATKTENILTSNKIYLLESGSYDSYDNMRNNTMGINYVYYEDDNNYKAIIAIVKDYDNIDKIKKIYDKDINVSEYYLADQDLNNKLIELDSKLKIADDESEIKNIVIEMLDLYRDDNSIKLVKIS